MTFLISERKKLSKNTNESKSFSKKLFEYFGTHMPRQGKHKGLSASYRKKKKFTRSGVCSHSSCFGRYARKNGKRVFQEQRNSAHTHKYRLLRACGPRLSGKPAQAAIQAYSSAEFTIKAPKNLRRCNLNFFSLTHRGKVEKKRHYIESRDFFNKSFW